jgi:Ala-tRNA(Pro) deacylase
MNTEPAFRSAERLEAYLRRHRVPFQVQHHPLAYTAQQVAAAEHVPGRVVAKVVVAFADERPVLLALPADYRVSIDDVAAMLSAGRVRLADERELALLFRDCELGAMPPFGTLYDLPVYVDHRLAGQEFVVFQAGTHRKTMSMAYRDFERLEAPTAAHFAHPA